MKLIVKSATLKLSDKTNRSGNESGSEFDQCQLSRELLMASLLQILSWPFLAKETNSSAPFILL